jgi:beta-1,4-mannosyltransferase
VLVLVLGDLGRSPRMLLHAQSLLEAGVWVDLVGYQGTELPDILINNSKCNVKRVKAPAKLKMNTLRWVYILQAVFRVLAQGWELTATLMSLPTPQFILCQVRYFLLIISR